MLTDRKDIAIWIFEPPYLVTRGSRPNSKLTILNEGVLFQDNAFVPEPSDHGFDIFYFPAQDRTLQWSEIRDFCDPNLVPSDANDQCVLIDAYKLKSEISFIEGTRLPPLLCLFEKKRWSGQELLHPEATDKTKASVSRAGPDFKLRAKLVAAFSTYPPYRHGRRGRKRPSSLPESPPQALRWSASTTRSSRRSARQCARPWSGRALPP